MKILRQKRHHAPLNHHRKQHNFPQVAARREPEASGAIARATKAIAAIAPQSNRRRHAIRSGIATLSVGAWRRALRRRDVRGPRGKARWCGPSREARERRSRLRRETKVENWNRRATKVSRAVSPKPPARRCSTSPRGGKAAARTNTDAAISAARKIGGRSCTTPTYPASTISVTKLVAPIENLIRRHSQKRNTTSAPTCRPATTST